MVPRGMSAAEAAAARRQRRKGRRDGGGGSFISLQRQRLQLYTVNWTEKHTTIQNWKMSREQT